MNGKSEEMPEQTRSGAGNRSTDGSVGERTITLERYRTLVRGIETLLGETSLEGLMRRAAESALEVIGATAAGAGYGREGGGFRVQAVAGCGEGAPGRPEESVLEEVQAALRDSRQAGPAAGRSEEGSESPGEAPEGPLATGLRGHDTGPGILLVMDKRQGAFTGEDAACLEKLADIASKAAMNVEARTLAEERAVEAEKKGGIIEAVMNHMPEGITVADAPDARIRDVSLFGAELIGRSREELLGSTADLHPELWGVLHKNNGARPGPEELPLTRAIRRGHVTQNEEWVLERPDGTRITISCNAGPVRNDDGEIVGGVIAWRDVTEQKQAEDGLKTAWDDLEAEVWRRTSELQTAKQSLEQEVREHMRTADRLRESNEVLESIFANTHLLMAYMDRDFNFIRVNEAYAAAAKRTVDFFQGKNHFDLYPHEENEALFRRVLETGEPYAVTAKPFEHPHQPERGVTYWDWSLQPVRDDRGEVSGVLLGLMDVTDRVKAEQERREGERKFRLLAETIEDVFWMSKPGITDMLYVSPAYEKVWGRSVASLYASPGSVIDAVHPEDRPWVLEEIKRHALDRYDLEYRVVRPDGEVRWVRDRGFPLRDGQGSVIGMCGTASDITGLKEAEAAIRESEQRARELQERSLDGFSRTDMELRFIEVNQAFEALVGYSESELREMTVQEITPDTWYEKELGMAEQLRREGHTPLYEKEFRRKDGTLVPVELRVHVSRDAEGTPREMWAFVRDITERKQAEVELLENVRKLEQSNRDLGDFAYVTSHDLQEPLRKIQTFGDRLGTKYADSLDERGRDYLERMINAATRMRGLIEALLRYSRVSTRQQPFSEVDLNEVVQEALYNLEDLIDRSGGAVAVSDLPRVEGDPHQLVQLMQNLIGNALKFHRPEVPPSIRIDHQRLTRGKGAPAHCKLRFEDNGIGIDMRSAEQIFKPFHRLHGRGEYEGAGMGLAICRKIVERHDGEIRVESEEGNGSVFVVTLPLKQSLAGQGS